METQAFEYSWQWQWFALYVAVVCVPLSGYYLLRAWRVRRQQVESPRISWRYAMSCGLALGLAMGALKNSNDEMVLATEQRQKNHDRLMSAGYRYVRTLQGPGELAEATGGCADTVIADWDFHLGERSDPVRYHVFCREGEAVMEVAASK